MTATLDKIWDGDPHGFDEALHQASALEGRGHILAADVMRASAYYSYASDRGHPFRSLANFCKARRHAKFAAERGKLEGFNKLSDGQCDVIGTILLREFLWWKSRPVEALEFFNEGLSRKDALAHSKALLHIGIAEASYALERRQIARDHIRQALDLEQEVLREPDEKQANHQFIRVLRRAFVLNWKMKCKDDAHALYCRAIEYAAHPTWANPAIFKKVEQAWVDLHNPHLISRFMPR